MLRSPEELQKLFQKFRNDSRERRSRLKILKQEIFDLLDEEDAVIAETKKKNNIIL